MSGGALEYVSHGWKGPVSTDVWIRKDTNYLTVTSRVQLLGMESIISVMRRERKSPLKCPH